MAAVATSNQNVIPDPTNRTQKQIEIYLNITLTGVYGVLNGHGDILDLGGLAAIPSDTPPTIVEIYEEPTAGNAPTGFSFVYARGVDIHTGKLIVLQNGAGNAPNAELTGGNAYPAALLAASANIKALAIFPYGV